MSHHQPSWPVSSSLSVLFLLLLCPVGSNSSRREPAPPTTTTPSPFVTIRIFVDPELGRDSNDGMLASSALRTLSGTQQRLRQTLLHGRHKQNIVINLMPGVHRVPEGGLFLDARDSPADGHAVYWKGASRGATSISGGEPVTGWKPAGDPTLPKNIYSAPAPARLRGSSARHLFVDGVRAVRTRQNASKALPGLTFESRPECVACSYSVNADSNVSSWSNPGDIEFVYSGVLASWAEQRCAVESVGPPPPPPKPPAPAPSPSPGSCRGVIHIHHTQGCFNYSDWSRGAPGSVFAEYESAVDDAKLTLESCGAACYKTDPRSLAGVMDGNRCFCGTAHDLTSVGAKARALPKGLCETIACKGNPSERACGGAKTMLAYAFSCDKVAVVEQPHDQHDWATQPSYVAAAGASVSATRLSEGNGTRITMKQPCFWNLVKGHPLSMGNRTPAFVENVRQHLRSPGQFYYDKTMQEVLYYPFEGQDLDKVQSILAVEETLVNLVGAKNHVWDGMKFEFATWLRPQLDLGYVEEQTGACDVCPFGVEMQSGCGAHDTFAVTPGNVIVSNGRNVAFVNCTFQHLGAYATSALNGSQNISWKGCTFRDVSAGAVALGDVNTWDETDPAQWDKDLLVEDCEITNTGVEYTGAAAVFGAYVASTTIQHNHIANTTYSGISMGWGWGHEAARRGDNHIIANRIERVLRSGRCCDGGGVYTLGPQPGSSVQGNYLFHAKIEHPGYGPFGHGGSALYHDEGSGGFLDQENVIDGPWDSWTHVRPYGWKCPGASGLEVDCAISVTKNWLRSNGTSTCSIRSATCHKVDPGFTIAGNIHLKQGSPLPPSAAVTVAAAGPRYSVPNI
eukprot:COSAG01_NODE_3278_length_6314_cov_2.240386_1_plen_851_part_00